MSGGYSVVWVYSDAVTAMHGVWRVFEPCRLRGPEGTWGTAPIANEHVDLLIDWIRLKLGPEPRIYAMPLEGTGDAPAPFVDLDAHTWAREVMAQRPDHCLTDDSLLISALRCDGQIMFVTLPHSRREFHAHARLSDARLIDLGAHRAADLFAKSVHRLPAVDPPSSADFDRVERALGYACPRDGAGLDHGSAMGRARLGRHVAEQLGAPPFFELSASRRAHVRSSEEFETLATLWAGDSPRPLALYHERDRGHLRICEDVEVVDAVRRVIVDIEVRREAKREAYYDENFEFEDRDDPGPTGLWFNGDPVLCQPYLRWRRTDLAPQIDPDLDSFPKALRGYIKRPFARKFGWKKKA